VELEARASVAPRAQLYEEATKQNLEGRSSMGEAELEKTVGREA
jgi:hypothetical protein